MSTRSPSRVHLAAVCLALLAACSRGSSTAVQGSGTVEVTELDIAPTVSARVVRVWVEEGAHVRPGDTLVSLTQSTLAPDIEQRRARVAVAEAALRDLTAGARPAELERAAAELRSAEAEAARAQTDLDRFTPLAARGDISQAQLDAVRATARMAGARRDAARESLRLVQQGARSGQIAQARAEVQTARASLQVAQASAGDLMLIAPIAGTVMRRYVEPGEVLAPGETTLTIADPTRPWVRVYLATQELANVRLGQRATATLDGMPGRAFSGEVIAIATKAEFTPRAALTEEERADLLFGVKVQLSDTTGVLKAGLPATIAVDTTRRTAALDTTRPAASTR
jgi:membrane fusion protein YbhG